MLKVNKISVKLISCLSIILLVFLFAGCSSAMDSGVMAPEMGYGVYGDNNEYLENCIFISFFSCFLAIIYFFNSM